MRSLVGSPRAIGLRALCRKVASVRRMASHKPNRNNAAALPFRACPAFSDHVGIAGGQKEIDNTYGGPERKRHSHEHDNKDRNFPFGYTFHFFARIEPISPLTLIRNISLPRDPARPAPINEQQARDQQAISLTATELTQDKSRSHRQKQR